MTTPDRLDTARLLAVARAAIAYWEAERAWARLTNTTEGIEEPERAARDRLIDTHHALLTLVAALTDDERAAIREVGQ